MKDFSRQPTQAERLVGIILTAALSILFGSLFVLVVSRGAWIAAIALGGLSAAAIAMLYRAAFGKARALGRKGARALAWTLLFLGLVGFAVVLLIPGPHTKKLMVLGGAITVFASGLAGVQRGRHDA